jgi:hypothetical protein
MFLIDRVKALAPQHPEWKAKEPFASLLMGDMEGVAAAGEKGAVDLLLATHTGMTWHRVHAPVDGEGVRHPAGAGHRQQRQAEVRHAGRQARAAEALKLAAADLVDDKEGKPVGIESRIGRRPIAAFGNSDGDLQMLQWTTAGSGPRFALVVHHDDAEREWAYDRTSHVGRLDKAWDEAVAKGWTVVSMKDDWKTIFGQR